MKKNFFLFFLFFFVPIGVAYAEDASSTDSPGDRVYYIYQGHFKDLPEYVCVFFVSTDLRSEKICSSSYSTLTLSENTLVLGFLIPDSYIESTLNGDNSNVLVLQYKNSNIISSEVVNILPKNLLEVGSSSLEISLAKRIKKQEDELDEVLTRNAMVLDEISSIEEELRSNDVGMEYVRLGNSNINEELRFDERKRVLKGLENSLLYDLGDNAYESRDYGISKQLLTEGVRKLVEKSLLK